MAVSDWPMPCSDHAVLLKAMAQHNRRETACGLPAHNQLLSLTMWSSTKVVTRSIPISDAGGQCETKQRLSWTRKRVVAAHYKKDDLLNCWTSISDIFGYHADFHKGHDTVRAWQGCGMLWQSAFKYPTVIEPHAMGYQNVKPSAQARRREHHKRDRSPTWPTTALRDPTTTPRKPEEII